MGNPCFFIGALFLTVSFAQRERLQRLKAVRLRLLTLDISITAVVAGIFLLFIVGNPKVFTRFDIYYSFMSTIPFFGIMALAMTLVVTLGEMDLSFPSVLAFSAWIFGKVFQVTGNIWLAVLVCFVIGLVAGALNSLLIVRVGIPSLVATIGTMFFFRGMVNVVAQGKGISLVKAKETIFYYLCVGRIGGVVPAQAVWMIVLGIGFWLLLNRHRFGSHILFVGDNEESSRMMGINVERVKTIVFMQMGFFAAFAGILSTLEVTYFWPSQGQGYLLTTLAAVFIGGTSVFGGMGTIYGTFVGAIIIGSLEAGIIAIGLTGFWIQLIYGLIIVVSVSIYAILLRKRG
jgi:simple sugar transport system permease protein